MMVSGFTFREQCLSKSDAAAASWENRRRDDGRETYQDTPWTRQSTAHDELGTCVLPSGAYFISRWYCIGALPQPIIAPWSSKAVVRRCLPVDATLSNMSR
jgi:hypothetical protein